MKFKFDVSISDNLNLNDYDIALSEFPTWKSLYREIKLNYLLENSKKVQFDIDNIQKYITLDDSDELVVSFKKICCSIDGMTFILNGNKVEKLFLRGNILDTENGKILKAVINNGLEFKINQFILGKILTFKINTWTIINK